MNETEVKKASSAIGLAFGLGMFNYLLKKDLISEKEHTKMTNEFIKLRAKHESTDK
jgi:hypothetical protein